MNPLLTKERLTDLIDRHGLQEALEMTGRGSGRTTGVALRAIGSALSYPGEVRSFVDHAGTSFRSAQHLVNMTRDMVICLGLTHLFYRIDNHGHQSNGEYGMKIVYAAEQPSGFKPLNNHTAI